MIPVGIQLYSVRDFMEKDFFATLKKVKEIGYDGVEFACGLFGKEPKEIAAYMKELDLVPVSTHIGLPPMRESEKVFEDYATIGCKYITVPGVSYDETAKGTKFFQMLSDLAKYGVIAKQYGLTLCYHNHHHEFTVMPDGRYAIDVMYETVPAELLQTQFDFGWVQAAGEDPVKYVNKYAGRVPTIHIKDMVTRDGVKKEGVYIREDAPLDPFHAEEGEDPERLLFPRSCGRGLLDIPSIVDAAKKAGTDWIIMEQDTPSGGLDSMECAAQSLVYLKDPKVNK